MAMLFSLLFIKPRMKGQKINYTKLISKTHKSLTISLYALESPWLAKRTWHYKTTLLYISAGDPNVYSDIVRDL